MTDLFPLLMFAATFAVLLSGFPVAFCLAGTAMVFAAVGILSGNFDAVFLSALPERVFGIMTNETLIAVPLFVFMGVVLERSRIAEDLLETMAQLFGGLRGGLYGTQPSLTELDGGDLRHTLDFRQLYTTAAHGWLGLPRAGSPLSGFAPLDLLT